MDRLSIPFLLLKIHKNIFSGKLLPSISLFFPLWIKIFEEKYDIKCFSNSLDEFLSYVDAVYIASPNETHYEYAKIYLILAEYLFPILLLIWISLS